MNTKDKRQFERFEETARELDRFGTSSTHSEFNDKISNHLEKAERDRPNLIFCWGVNTYANTTIKGQNR